MTEERVRLITFVRIITLLVTTLFMATPDEVFAKPKAPRLGMHTCTVGELNGVEGQDEEYLTRCNINGGTMYCDSKGFACCTTSPNGVEVCTEHDWARPRPQGSLTPNPRTFRPTPGTSGGIQRRGVEGEQPTSSEKEGK